MHRPSIYLAGPISGCEDTCMIWRREAIKKFEERGIIGLAPIDVVSQGLDLQRAAILQDRFDIQHCNAVLMNLKGAKRVSIGTMVELGWADAMGKPIVIVMDKNNLHEHGFVLTLGQYVVDDLSDAIDIVMEIVERQ